MDYGCKHHRRSIRLKGYDYSEPGAYFVTVVVQGHRCVLGRITDGMISPSNAGRIVEQCWLDLPKHYPNVELDELCIMPNHVHGIIVLTDCRGGSGSELAKASGLKMKFSGKDTRPEETRPYSLAEVVRAFKSFSARRINKMEGKPGRPFWQRGYYEHIIRDEKELRRNREYIYGNPWQWEVDHENPDFLPSS